MGFRFKVWVEGKLGISHPNGEGSGNESVK